MATVTPQQKSETYYTLLKYFARVTQFLAWPFIFIFFHLFFKIKMSGVENLRKMKSPFIVVSNHISSYDSFAFRLVLGLFSRNLPLRFMAVNSFDLWYLNFLSNIYVTDIIYALFGAFVVVQGRGIEKNLEEAVRIIQNGGNVVLFPEGSIILDGTVADFKLGAAVLAQKTGVPVVPVSMRIEKRVLANRFIVNVGEAIVNDPNATPEAMTTIFHDKVTALHASDQTMTEPVVAAG